MINVKAAKRYCCDDISLIENYDDAFNDDSNMWDCHHHKETDEHLSRSYLMNHNLYYHRPANELIFLPHNEHRSVHIKTQPKNRQKIKRLNQERIVRELLRKKIPISQILAMLNS